jgi:hypothetical protein
VRVEHFERVLVHDQEGGDLLFHAVVGRGRGTLK